MNGLLDHLAGIPVSSLRLGLNWPWLNVRCRQVPIFQIPAVDGQTLSTRTSQSIRSIADIQDHSITLSAIIRSDCGMVSPRALAVLRLIWR